MRRRNPLATMVFMHLDIFDPTAVMKKTDLGIYIAAQITKLFSHRVRRVLISQWRKNSNGNFLLVGELVLITLVLSYRTFV